MFAGRLVMNRRLRIVALAPYLVGGAIMWFLMFKSGVHATIASGLLAFAIPYSATEYDRASPSHRLEHALHFTVAFFILPIFALANTGIVIGAGWIQELASVNRLGIIASPRTGQADRHRAHLSGGCKT